MSRLESVNIFYFVFIKETTPALPQRSFSVVRRIATVSTEDIHELPGYRTLNLLAGVKVVEPHKRVRIGIVHAILATEVALLNRTRHIKRCGAVEVGRGIIVDILDLS